MRNTYDIAIVGATGTVGETLLSILAERDFPIGTLHLLDTDDLAGTRLEFGGSYIKVARLEDFDFSQVQIAFFATSEEVSATFVPIAALAGCVAIDHSAQFRTDYDVPLVIPEVNAHAIAEYSNRGIIATIYVHGQAEDVHKALAAKYDSEPFVHVLPLGAEPPQTRHVRGSNLNLISVTPDRQEGRTIIVSVLDNLVKGASGQAVQCANIVLGLEETMGLEAAPLFP